MPKKYTKLFLLPLFAFLFFASYSLVYAGNPPSATYSTLSATTVPADGTTQSIVTVTLKDASGSAVVGDTVQLSNATDSTLVISPTSASTSATGIATFSATSTTAGTDSITVTDTTTNTVLSALGQIIFSPIATPAPTSAPSTSSSSTTSTSCTNTPPASAPNLYQITSSSGSATLYFAPPATGFDGFTISYGLDSSASSYNVSFSQGPTGAAVSYTVNALTLNTVYYYKVRANNGCAPGPWSGVLSSNSGGGGTTTTSTISTPVTGPRDVMYLGVAGILMSVGGWGVFIRYR